MRKSRLTEEQSAMALRQGEAGSPVEEIGRKLGVSDATCFRWKEKNGGLGVWRPRELRQPREENRKLKGPVADLTLDKSMGSDGQQRLLRRKTREELIPPDWVAAAAGRPPMIPVSFEEKPCPTAPKP